MRIEELTIQMEGSQEIKEQWKEQNKITTRNTTTE